MFIFGFAKNARDDIDDGDECALKVLVKQVFHLVGAVLDRLIAAGKFEEVMCDGEDTG